MKRNPEYEGAKYIENDKVCYGSKVTAYFYVGDKIKEGDAFVSNEDTAYVDDMGSDWEKGHMLAKSLGGDNKVHNLLPMTEDVNNSTFLNVEHLGYKFPGQFMYTIEVQNSKDETVDEDKLRTVLDYLDITNEVELSDTLYVR